MSSILLVEDDENLGKAVKRSLEIEGFEVNLVKSLREAKEKLVGFTPTLILLDWMLPDGQGIDFLRSHRAEGKTTPVIMLTARTEVIDKVLGLEIGANDYITKPFDPRELVARIRVQERSGNAKPENKTTSIVVGGPIRLAIDTRTAYLEENPVELTKMEFDLLKILLENPNRVFSREELLNKVWGYDQYPTTRTVDTHILQLRQKFGENYFETVRGIGYRFKN